MQSCCCFFCFFKQKTAYELRISDWSSDVCSCDLDQRPGQGLEAEAQEALHAVAVVERPETAPVHRPEAGRPPGPEDEQRPRLARRGGGATTAHGLSR